MREKRILRDAQQARNLVPAWLSPILAGVFVIVGQVVGGLLLGIVLGVVLLAMVLPQTQGQNLIGQLQELQSQFADVLIFLELATFGFILGLVWIWVRAVEKRPFKSLGFYKDKWGLELLKGLGLGVGLFSLILLILTVIGAYRLEAVSFHPYAFGFAALIFPFWLLQGGTEELVIRGWLLPVMAARSKRIVAIIVSSAVFAIMHSANQGFSWLAVVNLVLFGLLMALYLLKTDNIWGLVGLHGAWNFAQGNIFGTAVSGQGAGTSLMTFLPQSAPTWLTGGTFGIEASVVTSLVLLLAVLYLAQQLKNEEDS